MFLIEKDPGATLDYTMDWSEWLVEGDEIASAVWTVDDGLTVELESNTTTMCTVWLSGGTVGEVYRAVNSVTTDGGRVDERTLKIKMVNR